MTSVVMTSVVMSSVFMTRDVTTNTVAPLFQAMQKGIVFVGKGIHALEGKEGRTAFQSQFASIRIQD